MTIDEEPLPVMDTGYTFEQLQAMNGMNMTEEDMMAAGMVPDAVANDVATAEPEVRRAEPNMQPTGAFMDLGFIDQINNAATDEEATAMYGSLDPVQKRVYDRSYGINISPEWAAGEAAKFYEEQDERAKAAADPRTQALEIQRNEKAQATRDQIGIMRGVVNDILQRSRLFRLGGREECRRSLFGYERPAVRRDERGGLYGNAEAVGGRGVLAGVPITQGRRADHRCGRPEGDPSYRAGADFAVRRGL
jgi:hypothetical protein